jgi:hypothetical protein
MTGTGEPTGPGDLPDEGEPEGGPGASHQNGDRPAALRLARLHLRTGSLALARVELETLAGAGALDDEALLDLAEVRWRTDDLTGAGEAAAAYIASGRVALIALVVAAEATAALGRPGEARRLAGRALELVDGPIDAIFAGMPRSDVWPAQRVERVAIEPLAPVAPAADAPIVAVPMAASMDPGRDASEAMPDPAAELAAARAALAVGDRAGAAIRLAVVLRLAPSLAPAVLDLAATESGPEFDLVRGDALRLVGRETQARRSFVAAARRSGTEEGAEAQPEDGGVTEPDGGEPRDASEPPT